VRRIIKWGCRRAHATFVNAKPKKSRWEEFAMKSYDVCECGAPLRLTERPTPKPVGTDVLLKIIAAGVCHSDLHIWEGFYDIGGGKRLKLSDRGVKLPLTMGHENVGEVVAVGPAAKGVKIGERKLVHPWLGCGECTVCRRGDEQLCRTPFSIGVFRSGGYADHLLVPHPRYLFDIGGIAPERAAPLACSGITTYGALKKVGPLLREEPVVIIGAGGLGLMCLSLHQAIGGKAAIVVDIDPVKRAAARRMRTNRSSRQPRAVPGRSSILSVLHAPCSLVSIAS
jgi:alcohol dehydrogenase, propanol-preferring